MAPQQQKVNLVIDIGNSFSKVAAFKGAELQKLETTTVVDKQFVLAFLEDIGEKVRHVILSAVKPYPADLDAFFRECFHTYIRLYHDVPLPLKVAYKTPKTLGMDRLAAVAGGMLRFPGKRLLVIDAGTCITYDFLNENLTYEGGAISPGIGMRFRALHNFTGQLPLIKWEKQKTTALTGQTTEEAILSGVINGTAAEMEGIIQAYVQRYPDICVILTGGDMGIFDKVLKNRIFADPNLVLTGLNEILRYNIED